MTTPTEQNILKEIERLEIDIKGWKDNIVDNCFVDNEDKEETEDNLNWDIGKLHQAKAKLSGYQLAQKETIEIIKKDIMLFEDARDILLDLKRQGVGTGDCEKFFDDRIIELKHKIFKETK